MSGAAQSTVESAWPRWLAPALLAALCVFLGGLSLSSLDAVQYQLAADEGAYGRYMERVATQGPGVFPELFREYVATPERWILPSPLRIGFIATLGALGSVFGVSLRVISGLSLVSHLAFVVLTWCFVRRSRGELAALAIAMLVGCSTLHLGLARRALLDSYAALWLAGAVWIFLELLSGARGRRWSVAFVLVFAWAVLVREATVVWLAPLAALFVVERVRGKTELSWRHAAIVLLAPLVLIAPLYVFAAGGIDPLLATVNTVRDSLAKNPYAIANMAGPWYRYIVDLVMLSPWTTLLGILGMGMHALSAPNLTPRTTPSPSPSDPAPRVIVGRSSAPRSRGVRDAEHACVATDSSSPLGPVPAFAPRPTLTHESSRHCLLLTIFILITFSFLEKDARYALVLFLPFAWFAWSAIEELARRVHDAWSVKVAVLALVLICASDVASYRTFFVDRGLYDPTSVALVRLRGLLNMPAKK